MNVPPVAKLLQEKVSFFLLIGSTKSPGSAPQRAHVSHSEVVSGASKTNHNESQILEASA